MCIRDRRSGGAGGSSCCLRHAAFADRRTGEQEIRRGRRFLLFFASRCLRWPENRRVGIRRAGGSTSFRRHAVFASWGTGDRRSGGVLSRASVDTQQRQLIDTSNRRSTGGGRDGDAGAGRRFRRRHEQRLGRRRAAAPPHPRRPPMDAVPHPGGDRERSGDHQPLPQGRGHSRTPAHASGKRRQMRSLKRRCPPTHHRLATGVVRWWRRRLSSLGQIALPPPVRVSVLKT